MRRRFWFFEKKKEARPHLSAISIYSVKAQQIWKNLNSCKTLNALLTTNRHEVNFCLTITYSLLLKGGHFDSKFDGWRHSLSSDQYSFSLSQRSTNLKKNKWKTHFRAWNTSDLKKKVQDMKHFATLRNISMFEVCCNILNISMFEVCCHILQHFRSLAEKWHHSLEREDIRSTRRRLRCQVKFCLDAAAFWSSPASCHAISTSV